MTNSGPPVSREGLSSCSKMGGNAPKCPATCGSVLHLFSLFFSVLSTAGFAVVLCFVLSQVKLLENSPRLKKWKTRKP